MEPTLNSAELQPTAAAIPVASMDDRMSYPKEELDEVASAKYKQRQKLEALKSYNININFMDRGCVIQVGCKSIAFESVEQAMVELLEYSENPEKVQQKWKSEFGLY